MTVRSAFAVVIGLIGSVSAQCYSVPDDQPGQGRCNWVPFGQAYGDPLSSNQRYQTVLTAADLGGAAGAITSLAFAPCGVGGAGSGTYRVDTLTIVMDHIAAGAALSTTFDSNLSAAAVTVLDVADHVWPVQGDQWNEIGLQLAFPYDPQAGDLVIEIIATGTGVDSGNLGVGMRRHSGRQRVFDHGWVGTPPATARFDDAFALKLRACVDTATAAVFGVGCPTTAPLTLAYSGASKIGSTLFADLSSGPAAGGGAVFLGLSNAPPMPLDLSLFGMPGCRLYVSQEVVLPVGFSGGQAQVGVPLPNDPSMLYTVFFNQGVALDAAANPTGVSTSNYGRAVIGS